MTTRDETVVTPRAALRAMIAQHDGGSLLTEAHWGAARSALSSPVSPQTPEDQPLLDAVAGMTPEQRLRLNDAVRTILAAVDEVPEERFPEEIRNAKIDYAQATRHWLLTGDSDDSEQADRCSAKLDAAIRAALRRARKEG